MLSVVCCVCQIAGNLAINNFMSARRDVNMPCPITVYWIRRRWRDRRECSWATMGRLYRGLWDSVGAPDDVSDNRRGRWEDSCFNTRQSLSNLSKVTVCTGLAVCNMPHHYDRHLETLKNRDTSATVWRIYTKFGTVMQNRSLNCTDR